MGYVLAELFMIAVEIYFWCHDRTKSWKEREEKPLPRENHKAKPLPRIVGSVPHVPLRK
jgi:hypothetical protein